MLHRRPFIRATITTLPHAAATRGLITYEFEEMRTRSATLHRADVYHRKRSLGMLKRGNLYRKQAKPFASVEQMERRLTELSYSAAERMPPKLLPTAVAELQLEGSAVALLDAPNAGAADALARDLGGDTSASEDVVENALSAREALIDDLTTNELSSAPWSTLGLDPAVALLAEKRFGPHATKVQARLLPALLHEDHQDVIFSSAVGSGKTAALILAGLHAARTESSGVNFIVSRSKDVAYAAHCLALSIVGRDVGGSLVDLDASDTRWMMLMEGKEQFQQHYDAMKNVQQDCRAGPRLIFTTADVIAELLFRLKLQFTPFGNLRRIYFDDSNHQFNVVRPGFYHSAAEIKDLQDNPSAADLVAATLHQIPGPHIRALLQIAAVSAGMDTPLKNHIKSLCIQPQRNAIIVAPTRLPSHIHCVFSFYQLFTHGKPDAPLAVPLTTLEEYLVQLLRNLNTVIPGRAVIFVASDVCLLTARAKLRSMGLDAKIMHEVCKGGVWDDEGWRFVVMHEHEGFGVDIPRLSHVFVTFVPSDRFALFHMVSRVGRLGAPGWAFVVTDQRDAPTMAALAKEIDIDVTNRVVTLDLRTCPASEVSRWSGEGSLSPMDPQYVVEQHYEELENDGRNLDHRELWGKVPRDEFWKQDYRDPALVKQKFTRAQAIFTGMEKDPRLVGELYRDGLITQHARPTKKFHALLEGRAVRR